MFEIKMFLNEKYNIDDMKLKKTLKNLNVMTLNRMLLKVHKTINNACQQEA